ncbi:YjbH domain-containing protein [SAR116 cluster bacterium]|nr:YjbH domain-containing protein [SAR116 cluster bacterium]
MNTFGLPGLIDMPAAGSFNDGQIGFNSSKHGPNFRNTITFQALPRVTGAFRYSGLGDRKMLSIDSGYTFWDRSFDVRLDIVKENKLLPEVTLGLQDFIGTGKYSGEYLVASKSIFDKIRLTGGLGWGRLASRNESVISKAKRTPPKTGFGGLLNYKQFFTGDMAFFSGLEVQTPIKALVLQAELSSDDYSYDHNVSSYSPVDNINYGAQYNLTEYLNLSAYYIQREEMGLRLKVLGDPKNSSAGNFMEPVPEPFYSMPYEKKDLKDFYINKLSEDLKTQKITLISSSEKDDIQIVTIENWHYSTNAQAFGRTLRIMSKYVPLKYNKFKVIISEIGVPIVELLIERDKVATIVDAPNAELLTKKITKINSAQRTYKNFKIDKTIYPDFYWSIYPYYRIHLFDPDKPLYHDFGPRLKFSYKLKPGIFLSGAIEKSVVTDFDEIKRGRKGHLPAVRTNLKNYLAIQDTRIQTLTATSIFKFSSDIYGRITMGYLEPMFAGISAEAMYFPINKNFSIGAEINNVKSREYRQLFKTREIKGMANTNGHVSGYWDTNFYDYLTQVDIGKYLANDNGATLTVSRNFSNGWKIGGFFTLTNATAREFGEGSFDKGIFLNIPLNSVTPFETQSSIYELIRPLQGDGGQRVSIPGRLYYYISDKSERKISNSWAAIWR